MLCKIITMQSLIRKELHMKISYKKLWILLIEKGIKKSDLRELSGLSAGTITRLNKNQTVSINALLQICKCLKCDIGDICSAIENE